MGISFVNGKASFRTNYSDTMIDDPQDIIHRMRIALKGVKYDTIVGRGTSGMLIVPLVAKALRKKWLVVRKPEEYESSHSGVKWLGDLGNRWIFLDDFCSSGRTFREVRDGIADAVTAVNRTEKYDESTGRYVRNNFQTELVGYFEYERRNPEQGNGWVVWDENASPGYSDMYNSDTPKQIKAEAEKLAAKVRAGEDTTPKVQIANPDFCCEACTPGTPRTIDGVTEPTRVQSMLDERVSQLLYGEEVD
jgi:hypoxanthine phosphoribosyltransferase